MTFALSFFIIASSVLLNARVGSSGGISKEFGDALYNTISLNTPFMPAGRLVKHAKWLYENRDYKLAAKFYSKAITKKSNEASYYEMRGKCYFKDWYSKDALSDFKKAVSLSEKNSGGKVEAGTNVLDATELVDLGKRLTSDSLSSNCEGIEWCFTEAIKRKPSDASYYVTRGNFYLDLNNWNAAMRDFNSAKNLDPYVRLDTYDTLSRLAREIISRRNTQEHEQDSSEDLFRVLNEVEIGKLAQELMRKDLKEAIHYFTKAIELSPLDPDYHRDIGLCYMKQKDWDTAISYLNEALSIKADDRKASEYLIESLFYSNRLGEALAVVQSLPHAEVERIGQEFFYRKDFEFAAQLFTEAINKDPSNALYYRQRIDCYLKSSKFDLAVRDLRKIIHMRYSPQDRLDLVRALLGAGRSHEAIQETTDMYLDNIISLGDDFSSQENGCDKAIHCYNEAIRRNSNRVEWYEKRADCYRKLKEFDRAFADFEAILKLSPHHKETNMKYCEALLEIKKYNQAKVVLKNLESKHRLNEEDTRWVAEARQKIRKMEKAGKSNDYENNSQEY